MGMQSPELIPGQPITESTRDTFITAYGLQMNGKNPIQKVRGVGGQLEAIALDPEKHGLAVENVRYIIVRPDLESIGYNAFVNGQAFKIEFGVIKFTLATEDSRSMTELTCEDLRLTGRVINIGENGDVIDQAEIMAPSDIQNLTSSIGECVVVSEFPSWNLELI